MAIRAIEDGSTYFPSLFTEARRAHSRDPFAFDKILTDREQTILSLVGEPLSDAEIAAQLKLSPETVEKHRFNIMRKLGLRSRAESARFARRCGLTAARGPPPLSRHGADGTGLQTARSADSKVRCKAIQTQPRPTGPGTGRPCWGYCSP